MTAPLNILILGGTAWLGGTLARHAHARGHHVVCLARGESGTVPDGVELVRADRRHPDAYAAVADRDWDAVIDVTWQPAQVTSALVALARRARHWLYVSSVSAYRFGPDAEAGTTHAPWSGSGAAGREDYGPAKVSCETSCRQALADDALLVARAGLIAGYGDGSDRFGYWPARIAAALESSGGPVLAPPMGDPVQVIDVEDLAAWLVTAAEKRIAGTFDAVGDRITMGEVIGSCTRVLDVELDCTEPGQDWLVAHGVEPWAGPESLPLWLPLPEHDGMMTRNNAPAREAGMSLRPLDETVASALRWETEQGLGRERHAGLSPQREHDLLHSFLGAE